MASFELLPYSEDLAPAAAEAFNRAVSSVPHCYPVSPEDYVAATMSTTGEDGRGTVRNQETIVALSNGRIVGFAATALCTAPAEGSPETPVIRTLWCERGNRQAGQALLTAAEEILRRHGANDILAFDPDFRFPGYHLPNAGLSDRWDHVHGLLGMHGYARVGGEVFLDWQGFCPPDPVPCPIDVDVRTDRWPGKGGRANLAVVAHDEGERVGICACSCGGEHSRDERAQDWVFTDWVWVEDSLRGRGLGRHLLICALNEARAAGYVHAAISAEWTNHTAILFYGNIGFRAVDWTSKYRRGAMNEPA